MRSAFVLCVLELIYLFAQDLVAASIHNETSKNKIICAIGLSPITAASNAINDPAANQILVRLIVINSPTTNPTRRITHNAIHGSIPNNINMVLPPSYKLIVPNVHSNYKLIFDLNQKSLGISLYIRIMLYVRLLHKPHLPSMHLHYLLRNRKTESAPSVTSSRGITSRKRLK